VNIGLLLLDLLYIHDFGFNFLLNFNYHLLHILGFNDLLLNILIIYIFRITVGTSGSFSSFLGLFLVASFDPLLMGFLSSWLPELFLRYDDDAGTVGVT
jgi:hypothetical protein